MYLAFLDLANGTPGECKLFWRASDALKWLADSMIDRAAIEGYPPSTYWPHLSPVTGDREPVVALP